MPKEKRVKVGKEYITVDEGIAPIMKEFHKAGLKTVTSCSGLKKDHDDDCNIPYVCFQVAKAQMGDGKFGMDFPAEAMTPQAMELHNEIDNTPWRASFGSTYFVYPTVCAHQTDVTHNEWTMFGRNVLGFVDEAEPWEIQDWEKIERAEEIYRDLVNKSNTDEVKMRKWNMLKDRLTSRKWDFKVDEVV